MMYVLTADHQVISEIVGLHAPRDSMRRPGRQVTRTQGLGTAARLTSAAHGSHRQQLEQWRRCSGLLLSLGTDWGPHTDIHTHGDCFFAL